jgi:uncharacterized membrane protein
VLHHASRHDDWVPALTSDSLLGRLPLGGARLASRADPAVRHRRANLWGVAGLTALVAIGYSAFSLLLQYTVRTHAYDLVIFDQAVRSYAHFQPGISPLKGYHNGFGPDFSVLGDHWSPIIATLAPLYWIHNGPQNLLIAQGVLLALAIPPVWLFTRRALGGPGSRKATIAAYLVSITYALSWPIQGAVGFDFHEVAFAPVLTAVGLERLQAGKKKTGLLALAGLFLVKEDCGLLVAGIGVALLLMREPWVSRRIAAAMIPVGVIVTFVEVYVLIPAMGGRSGYYWAYPELGRNVRQAAVHVLTHPLTALHALTTPGAKVDLLLLLLAPYLFLALLSPLSVAALPLLLERLLNVKYPGWWGTSAQYNAYLIIIVLFAAVDGLARLDGRVLPRLSQRWRTGRLPVVAAGVMAAVSIALVPSFDFGQLLHPAWYHRNAYQEGAVLAAAHVPDNVVVEAASNVAAQLTSRDTVLFWDGDGSSPLFPDWVVTYTGRLEFTFRNIADQIARVNLLKEHGYVIVYSAGGYLVMHKPGIKT